MKNYELLSIHDQKPSWVYKMISRLLKEFVLFQMLYLIVTMGSISAQNWEPLPIHLDAPARCFLSDTVNDRLYIGGNFRQVDGMAIQGIISYDGARWDSLGGKIGIYPILCMTKYDGKLIVGGFGGIAAWDGQNWEEFLFHGVVGTMMQHKGKLLIGGRFEVIAGDSIRGLAAFNGSSFSRVFDASFLESLSAVNVGDLLVYQDKLYVAGSFGDGPRNFVLATWDGYNWAEAEDNFGGGGSTWISDLAIFDGELFAAGYFSEQGGAPGNNIAKWDGNRWNRIGLGLGYPYGQVFKLNVFHGKLFAVGAFLNMGGISVNSIASWNGTQWCIPSGEIDNALSAACVYRNELYIAGGFRTIDNDSIQFLAKWIGGSNVDTCVTVPVAAQDPAFPSFRISLFPNPTHESFTLSIPIESGPTEISIHDATGRKVIDTRKYIGEAIDVSALSSGLYFVRVNAKNWTQTVKLLKE